MPSSYTPLLRLTLPADGELVGTWGQTINNGMTLLEESAIAGTAVVPVTDGADTVLTTANGAADQARAATLRLTGALTAQRNVVCPAVSKNYFVRNATTGGFGVQLKTAAGTGVVVAAGTSALVYCDGVNVVEAVTGSGAFVLKSGDTMTGSLTIDNGFLTAKRYANVSVFLAQRADGAVGAPIVVGNGQPVGMWIASAYDGAAYRTVADIRMYNTASPTAGSSPGYISFNTTPIGSTVVLERMRIMDSGSVGIGDSTAPVAVLDVFKNTAISAVPALRVLSNNAGFSPGSYAGLAFYWNLSGGAAESTLVYGNTANSFLAFGCHNGTSYSERMRVDVNGNVGIGTAAPSAATGTALAINGGANGARIALKNAVTGDAAGDGFQIGIVAATGEAFIEQRETQALRFATDNTERMRIDAAGNVGVAATPSPWDSSRHAVEVLGAAIWGDISNSNAFFSNNVYFNSSFFYRLAGLGSVYSQASGAHIWYTVPSGSAGAAASLFERMRITNDGNVLINTNTFALPGDGFIFQAGGGSILYVGHAAAAPSGAPFCNFLYNSTNIGSITQNGTTGVNYNPGPSDYRLKDEVTDWVDSGAVIDALRPRKWRWKSDGSVGIGFVAHEFGEVLPMAVTGAKDAVNEAGEIVPQMFDPGTYEMMANIIAELKSLRRRVAALEV